MRGNSLIAMDDATDLQPNPSFGFGLGHHFLHMRNTLQKTVDSERCRLVHGIASLTSGLDLLFNRSPHDSPAIAKATANFCARKSRRGNSQFKGSAFVNGLAQFNGLGFVNGLVNVLGGFGAEQRFSRRPLFACMSSAFDGGAARGNDGMAHPQGRYLFDVALSTGQVSKRLDGVPVYTVSNSSNEFVLVSDPTGQKSLGLFCFRQEDAEALLAQVKDREPVLGRGAKVVAVSLDKVYQLNTEGIAFRFLPDPVQVKHALQARGKGGNLGRVFDGVPVFQSENLILRSNNRRFCPVFFCKEDLERALLKAFKKQQRGNPSLRVNTDIQVGSFEDVLKKMESSEENSGWEDIVFIPPGMDALHHLGKAVSQMGDTVVG